MLPRTLFLTGLAMLAFAGNSLLCRLALGSTDLDAASFTTLRLVAGALTLLIIASLRRPRGPAISGNWRGACALFVYAAAFSLAYVQLDTGAGALLLFGAVQISMLTVGALRREPLGARAALGSALAAGGLLTLLLPGASAPPFYAALLMLLAGLAWAWYTLLGQGSGDPLAQSTGHFWRAAPLCLPFMALNWPALNWDSLGAVYAIASGAITSALGYALWYSVLPALRANQAATVQLSVPVLAGLAGVVVLGEPLTPRLALCALAILGGVAVVLSTRQPRPGA